MDESTDPAPASKRLRLLEESEENEEYQEYQEYDEYQDYEEYQKYQEYQEYEESDESEDSPYKHKRSTAPDQDSPLHILNILNDHCLQIIFKQLSVVDLGSASEVCTRFKRNAEEIFSLKHENRFRVISLCLVKPQVFNNFHHLMKSVYLNGSNTNLFLNYFNERSSIETLHIRSASIKYRKLKSLLPKLTSLELSSCEFVGDASDLLATCNGLQYLRVKLSKFDQFRPCKMPTLKRFEYEDYVYTENLRLFIETNPHLTSISIATVNKIRTPVEFAAHLLEFGFKSLNSLRLPCFQFSVAPLVETLRTNNNPLQQLELMDCRMDDAAFRDIFQMKSIKILSVTGIEFLSQQQFMELATELPELEVLRLETAYNHYLKFTIDDIKSFVEQSKNLYLLTIGTISNITIDKESYNHLLGTIVTGQRKGLNITIIYDIAMKIVVPKPILITNKAKIRIVKMRLGNFNYNSIGSSDGDYDDDDDSDGSDASEDENGSTSGDSSNFESILGSADDLDDDSDDNWLADVYNE